MKESTELRETALTYQTAYLTFFACLQDRPSPRCAVAKGTLQDQRLPGLAVLCTPKGHAPVRYRILVLGSSRHSSCHGLHRTSVSFTIYFFVILCPQPRF